MAVGDHEWWLDKLSARLRANRAGSLQVHGRTRIGIDTLQRYVDGDPPLPDADSSRLAWQAMRRRARTNLARSIVEAMVDRLHVTAYYTAAGGDENGDDAAWRVWAANDMPSLERTLYLLAGGMRTAYAMVSDPALGPHGEPVVSVEDPRYCITAHDPLTREVRAALKVDRDDDMERDVAYVSVAGAREGRCEVRRYVRPWSSGLGWALDPAYGLDGFGVLGGGSALLPFREVNVVRYVNNPDAHLNGQAEHEPGLDVIDRIYSITLLRLVVAVSQAFRKTGFVKGIDAPALDGGARPVLGADGQPTGDVEDVPIDEQFELAPDAAWDLPPGWTVWESAVTDLGPLLGAELQDFKALGAVTRTPVDLLIPDQANQSAEGASAKRETLTTKVEARQTDYGVSHAALMRLAFLWKGDAERASAPGLVASWAPATRHSLSERYAAAVQAKGAGVPWPTIMRDVLQFSPADVERMETERDADLLYADAAAATAEPAGQAPAQPQATPGG